MSPSDPSSPTLPTRIVGRAKRDIARVAAKLAEKLAPAVEPEEPETHTATVEPRDYGTLYEAHAQNESYDAIGGGDYVEMGAIELDALRAEGLRPDSTLVDFGCGTGRLAQHAIPFLTSGRYVGIDISPTFLARAQSALAPIQANSSCDVRWIHQDEVHFDPAIESVDMFCAFSVITHLEHEDTLRYLQAIRPLMKQSGRLVLSCLPLSLLGAQGVFLAEASMDLDERWSRVRNVVTSVDLMDQIADLAGWTVLRWLPGDENNIPGQDGELRRLGQSILVLTPNRDS